MRKAASFPHHCLRIQTFVPGMKETLFHCLLTFSVKGTPSLINKRKLFSANWINSSLNFPCINILIILKLMKICPRLQRNAKTISLPEFHDIIFRMHAKEWNGLNGFKAPTKAGIIIPFPLGEKALFILLTFTPLILRNSVYIINGHY